MSIAPKCSSPGCRGSATKEWGIDKAPVCDACYAEVATALDAVLKQTDARDAALARQRIDND